MTERFIQALFKALLNLDIPADMAAAEAEAVRPLQLAKSNSNSVLGTLNQFAFQVEGHVWQGDANSAAELTRLLANMVVLQPKHIGFPADRVREAFGLPPSDSRRLFGTLPPPGTVLH